MGGTRQANPSCRTSWWESPGSRRPLKQTSPRGCVFSEQSVRIIRSGRLARCVQPCTLSLVQGDVRSEEVVAKLFNGSSPKKRCGNPWAVGEPAQRNARRRYAKLGGNGVYGIDHLPFDLACQQVVLRLQRNRRGDAQVARGQNGPLELPPCEVGHSDIPNLSRPHEGVERQTRLLDRRGRVPLMRLIEVDVIRIEPAEAALAGANDPSPRQALRVTGIIHAPATFGCEDDSVAHLRALLQPPADDLF